VTALALAERVRSLGHEPLGPVPDGAQAVGAAKAATPDLYLFDIEMPALCLSVSSSAGSRRDRGGDGSSASWHHPIVRGRSSCGAAPASGSSWFAGPVVNAAGSVDDHVVVVVACPDGDLVAVGIDRGCGMRNR
jgi:hypothetical protein